MLTRLRTTRLASQCHQHLSTPLLRPTTSLRQRRRNHDDQNPDHRLPPKFKGILPGVTHREEAIFRPIPLPNAAPSTSAGAPQHSSPTPTSTRTPNAPQDRPTAAQYNADEVFAEYARHFTGVAMPERTRDRSDYQVTQFPANWSTDHRSICTQQNLVHFSGLAPGHPIFDRDGTFIFKRLMDYLRAQYPRYGIKEVVTPSVWKRDLWKKSGHGEIFKDEMFGVSQGVGDEVNEEDGAYMGHGLKPMNCPAHCEIFEMNQKTMSYRDLPVRMAEFSGLFRNEVYSALSGLTRCREFHQDDCHIFCRADQVQEEILNTLRFVRETYSIFRLPEPTFKIATRPERFLGNLQKWEEAEHALHSALRELQVEYTVAEGDGAFYGPKIDINLEDRRGRLNQLATIQLDFQLPERFDLKYRDETLQFRRPVIIHRAVMGSVERFLALVMENCEGRFPFWLSPKQCMIVPIHEKDEILVKYALEVKSFLTGMGSDKPVPLHGNRHFNVDVDVRARRNMTMKVKTALENYNFVAVVGHNEVRNRTVMLEGKKFPPREVGLNDLKELFARLEDMYL